jgi:hypothetical protein
MRPIFKQRGLYFFILLTVSLVMPGFVTISVQNEDIILHDERLPVTPREFYIANVTDERVDPSAVAWLLPRSDEKGLVKAYPVDLQGGFTVIKQFIDRSLPQNTNLRPIIVSLKKCKVTETQLPGGLVEGHITINMSFSLQQDDEALHLLNYNGNGKYTRNAGPPQEIEPALRKVLGNGLIYLNTWMNREANTDIKLAKAVKVSFTDYQEKPEGDTIYYSASRPLTWDDFKSKIADKRFAAEVYPTIGYNEHTEVNNGIISLKLNIKVCLPKSAAWVRDGVRTDYILNHEQRHFDIAKIAAGHFIQKVKAETLPVFNYDGPINVDYLDAYREMDSLQMKYDKETSHGMDRFMQQKWNEKIDEELKVILSE